MWRRSGKYNSRKIRVGKLVFDSILEYERWLYLQDLERQHKIFNLRRQVPFELIPEVTETREKVLKTKVKTEIRVVERGCSYFADFTYDKPDGDNVIHVIEDTKSEATRKKDSYIIKRKLMREQGNVIREVLSATENV